MLFTAKTFAIFAAIVAFTTTVTLFTQSFLPMPAFSNRSQKTMGRIVDIFKLPFSDDSIYPSVFVKIEFYANHQKRVKEISRGNFINKRLPRVGDKFTLCYNPDDVEDVAVERNNKLNCAPPDAITTLAVYLVRLLVFLITFFIAYLAFRLIGISTCLILSGGLVYLVFIGLTGIHSLALIFAGICSPIPVVIYLANK